jgi:hypothetical protein
MRKIKINVTAKDIKEWQDKKREDKGIQSTACEICAVANALHRHKEFKNARVGYTVIRIADDFATFKEDKVFNIPADVTAKIKAIDRLDQVAPFSFTLEVISKWN